jgi:hypothetical protein
MPHFSIFVIVAGLVVLIALLISVFFLPVSV